MTPWKLKWNTWKYYLDTIDQVEQKYLESKKRDSVNKASLLEPERKANFLETEIHKIMADYDELRRQQANQDQMVFAGYDKQLQRIRCFHIYRQGKRELHPAY